MEIAAPESQHDVLCLLLLIVVFQLPHHDSGTYPPKIRLRAVDWLPPETKQDLEAQARTMRKVAKRPERVLANYLFHLRSIMRNRFDLDQLNVREALIDRIANYNRKLPRELFKLSSFECGVFLSTKPGSQCCRLERCVHAFCIEFLRLYHRSIKAGDVDKIKCIAFNCGNENLDARAH